MRTPTFTNLYALLHILPGSELADVPLQILTIDPVHQLHGAVRRFLWLFMDFTRTALKNLFSKPATRQYPPGAPGIPGTQPRPCGN